MFDHLIYDFDGTLSDTYPIATEVLVQLLAERGITVTPEQALADLKVSFGHVKEKYGFPGDPTLNQRVIALALEKQMPFPEAPVLLRRAVEMGKKNYIYTHSGKEVQTLLEKWGMADDVTFILDKTYGFPIKPDPTALRYLLDRFSIDPATALMIGDRDIDILAGQNAGLRACLFDFGGFYPDCKAEYRVDNLLQLLDII